MYAGYCSNTIEQVFTRYERSPKALKEYMGNLQVNTPPPLAASAQKPDKQEAVEDFVSRYNISKLIH
jgi:hypothetical protein